MKVCPGFVQYVHFRMMVSSTQSLWTKEGVNKMQLHSVQSSTILHKYKKCHYKMGNFFISKTRVLESEGRHTFIQLWFFFFLQRQLIWWLYSFFPVKKNLLNCIKSESGSSALKPYFKTHWGIKAFCRVSTSLSPRTHQLEPAFQNICLAISSIIWRRKTVLYLMQKKVRLSIFECCSLLSMTLLSFFYDPNQDTFQFSNDSLG